MICYETDGYCIVNVLKDNLCIVCATTLLHLRQKNNGQTHTCTHTHMRSYLQLTPNSQVHILQLYIQPASRSGQSDYQDIGTYLATV